MEYTEIIDVVFGAGYAAAWLPLCMDGGHEDGILDSPEGTDEGGRLQILIQFQ